MTAAGQRLFVGLVLIGLMVAGVHAQEAAKSRVLGTVTAISGSTITVRTDAGATENVTVPDTARILKTAPGEKTLSGAAKIGLGDIAGGDRVLMLVAGDPPAALIVVVNKASDLAAMQQQEREEWQRNGVGGLVKSVDPAAGTVTVASGAHIFVIHTTPSTVIRRYAPDSVKFSDAQPSTLAAIQPGNQLQARGEKSADGAQITAAEIVSGAFRNIAGIVTSVDAQNGTFSVKDWTNKKTVTIRSTPDSDMRKLDPQMAQTIAARLRAGAGQESADGGAAHVGGSHQGGGTGAAEEQGPGHQGGAGNQGGGLARLLQNSPEIHAADLHKGDAVMIVATEGSPDQATAIRVVAGVEAMLQASAKDSQSMFSSAWSLGGGSDQGGEGTQ